MRVIRFFRLDENGQPRYKIVDSIKIKVGEIAFNEEQLRQKLDGDLAEVHIPAKPFYTRWWRKVFPLRGEEK